MTVRTSELRASLAPLIAYKSYVLKFCMVADLWKIWRFY